MIARRQPDPDLVPIRKTAMFPTFRNPNGPKQCWAAETLDGIWAFERAEEPGTPWYIYHLPSVRDGSWRFSVRMETTLRGCRLAVGRGWAARDMERRKSEAAREGGIATIGA